MRGGLCGDIIQGGAKARLRGPGLYLDDVVCILFQPGASPHLFPEGELMAAGETPQEVPAPQAFLSEVWEEPR